MPLRDIIAAMFRWGEARSAGAPALTGVPSLSAGVFCNMLLLVSRASSLHAATARLTAFGRDLLSTDGAYGAYGEVEQMHSDEDCATGMALGTIGALNTARCSDFRGFHSIATAC